MFVSGPMPRTGSSRRSPRAIARATGPQRPIRIDQSARWILLDTPVILTASPARRPDRWAHD